jgi:glutamate dehydrogenase/leucine dehydrogenase
MKDLLKKFENKQPEIVFHWKDTETDAEGWTVINSLRGGAAGGGTRMRKGLDMNEVLSLAKTMEVKFQFLVQQLVVQNLESILTQMIQEKRCFTALV